MDANGDQSICLEELADFLEIVQKLLRNHIEIRKKKRLEKLKETRLGGALPSVSSSEFEEMRREFNDFI